MVSGLKQALQYHPTVVIAGAIPYVTWQSVIPAYKAAHVPLVAFAAGATITFPVVTEVVGFQQYRLYGEDLADWFIADSKGKGHALITGSTDAAALAAAVDGFQAEVKAKCPGCTSKYHNLSLQDINSGGAIQASVSEVQRDPSINYLFSSNGSFFTGLASKLASLGLSKKVKIAGLYGTSNDLANVKAGTEAAWLNYSVTQIGWATMDAALRYSEGMPMDPNEADVPLQLLIPGGDFKVANSTDVPADYAAQYKALWKVS
jgi:ribose transport system substrate-binding protein